MLGDTVVVILKEKRAKYNAQVFKQCVLVTFLVVANNLNSEFSKINISEAPCFSASCLNRFKLH